MNHDFSKPHKTCFWCSGCDQEGCGGECHGNPFGVHPAHEADPLEVSEAERIELTIARLKVDFGVAMSDSVTTRVRRLLQGGRHVDNAGYWMMNYAQACEGRLSVERQLDAMRQERDALRINEARRKLADLENAFEEEWG